jgi:hypothetical protein
MKDEQCFTFQQSVILKTVVPLLILACTSYTRFGNVLLRLTKFQNFHMVDWHAINFANLFLSIQQRTLQKGRRQAALKV